MHKKATSSLLGGYRAAFTSRMAGCNKGTCVVYAEYKTITCPDKALIGTHFEQLLSLFHGFTMELHCTAGGPQFLTVLTTNIEISF